MPQGPSVPELPYAAKAADQSQKVKELLNKQADQQNKRIAAIESGRTYLMRRLLGHAGVDPDDAEFERINNMIQETAEHSLNRRSAKPPTRSRKNDQQ